MKWCVNVVLVCWTLVAIAAREQSPQILNDKNDGGDSIDSKNSSSIFKNEYGVDTGSQKQSPDPLTLEDRGEDSVPMMAQPLSRFREPLTNYLKSSLDVFNIGKVETFLNENGKNISDACNEQLMQYLTGLKEKEPWALKILDATGSYSYTFLFGNDYWLGSQSACLDLLYMKKSNNSPPFRVTYYSVKYHVGLNISSEETIRPVTVGVCLPAECQENDLRLVLDNISSPTTVLRTFREVPNQKYNFYMEPIGITLVVITIIGMILVGVGTWKDISQDRRAMEMFDQGQRNKELGQNKTSLKDASAMDTLTFYVNPPVEGTAHKGSELGLVDSTNSINGSTSSASVSSFESVDNNLGVWSDILICFSFRRNLRKICNTKTADSLACVHGLRVFSLLWVIAGHTCMITMPFVDNKSFRTIVERDFLFQSISNGAFSVDTFFFISGLLIAFVFYKAEIEKNRDKEESAETHARNSLLKFVGGVTYRLVRLTPPYLVVLVLTYLTGRWFYFNSVFESPVGDHFTCQHYWWRNLLYINTLFPVDQMCMIWSWYLADDTQFYFLGLVLLLMSSRYVKGTTAITTILVISSWITTVMITLSTQHKPSIEEPLGLFDQLYDKPWTRLAPYIVGMAVGVYLAKINCKATYHKGLVAFLWVISMLTTFVLVHGLYGELGQVESAAYVALSHTAWALAISWVIIACVTGYGGPVNAILSSKMFAPLSRLTYCAYLIHPLIMLSAMAHMDGPIHLQRDTMIISIFGYFFASYLASIVLTLIFEAPAVALLNKFHPLKKKVK